MPLAGDLWGFGGAVDPRTINSIGSTMSRSSVSSPRILRMTHPGGFSARLSQLNDGSGSPVNVQIDGLTSPITKTINVNDYASVTGPAGLVAGGVAVVRVRSDADIHVY